MCVGPQLDGASLYKLIKEYRVTHTAAVPTVCAGLLQYCAEHGRRLDSLHTVVIGGAATPASMIRKFQSDHGITVRCLWGEPSLTIPPTPSSSLDQEVADEYSRSFVHKLEKDYEARQPLSTRFC